MVTEVTFEDIQDSAIPSSLKRGTEYYFTKLAVRDNKSIKSLDSLSDIEQISNISNDYGLDKLEVSDVEQSSEFINIFKYWSNGDLDNLKKIIKSLPKKMVKNLLNKRNRNWVKKIKKISKKPVNHFVVVGCLHLPSKKGLVNLLKDDFLIDRVYYENNSHTF